MTSVTNRVLDLKRVEHSVQETLAQRIYGLALGYEDINDHEQLRNDPVFGVLAGRVEIDEPLAGKSSLNCMELGTGINSRYKKITFWKEGIDELRSTSGNRDHITFAEVMSFAAFDIFAQPLIRPGLFAADHLAAGHEGRFSVDYVEDVRLLLMPFNLSGAQFRAPRGQ